MINEETRLLGRQLFEERLKDGKKYIVYRSEHDGITHALMDGHTHLAQYCSSSPRLFFTSTKGSSGKTRATQLSWFYVQYPILATASGASLIWDFNEGIEKGFLPTIIYDEAQDAWKPPGNDAIQALFNSYLKGFPRTVWDGSKPKKLDLFCSVIINGLLTKYQIPANFLERCIPIQLLKRLGDEIVADFEFGDLREEIGDDLRMPRMDWAKHINRDDIKSFRAKISAKLKEEGIVNRDAELWKPLCEYAYLCGDDTFESAIDAAKHFLKKTAENRHYTLKERLLADIHEVFCEKKEAFLTSADLCDALIKMEDRPWKVYKGSYPLNQHNLAFLLEDYKIRPEKGPNTTHRGYYIRMFMDVWERDLGLKMPPLQTALTSSIEDRGGELDSAGAPVERLKSSRLVSNNKNNEHKEFVIALLKHKPNLHSDEIFEEWKNYKRAKKKTA